MNLTVYIWTGIGASRLGRATTFAGRSRSSNVSLVQEDTRVSLTTARSRAARTSCHPGSTCSARWQSGRIASGPSGAASSASSRIT